MKHIVLLLSILGVMSCHSVKKTQRAMNSGNYTEAINGSIEQLQKNKSSKKSAFYAEVLKKSFQAYREQTLKTIDFLERETLKDNSKAVYESYVRLQNIQNRIKPLLPLENENGEVIAFNFYDFTDNILAGKENYANYLYLKASNLLNSNDKINSRLAYNDLIELNKLAPGYKDTSSLLKEAYLKGIDLIYVALFNDTEQVIPKEVEERLLNFTTFNLDDFWTEFHIDRREAVSYDYAVEIYFTSIQFSPERLLERQIPLEREIVEGWRYKKDRSGNYILDDKGNKIKEDVRVKANGILYETLQSKEVKVIAEVEYFDLNADQKINAYPLESTYVFENRFADFEGDSRILNRDEAFLLRGRPVKYPSDQTMLIDASDEIKDKLKSILKRQQQQAN
ncbi:hypothetical protein G3567_08825 [Psychroflexus sp. YR1-1]|uniref:Lipoprotein n=1 Tax=Psychroflexus aurantiacus TaxID=2709310 RepID=A0A6B3R9K3_9FLAO|nr:hypothetical protein [Psychroflexus aurantiacus]NEV94244.1 hypothetical protein [Psychroflexus aurantiacus]